MDFGEAISHLKDGGRVSRTGWNGPGQLLYYVAAESRPDGSESGRTEFGAFIAICTVQGNHVPWLASQTDMLAEDWVVV